MLKRFLTGMVIMVLLVGSFALRFVSPYIFDGFLGVVIIFSAFEVATVLKKNNRPNDLYFVLAYPVLIYLSLLFCKSQKIGFLGYFAITIGLAVLLFCVTLVLNLILKKKTNKEMAETVFVGTRKKYVFIKSIRNLFLMAYPTFILSMLFVLNHIKWFNAFASITGNIEFLILVLLFATTIMTDTMAYLGGSAIGGPKLCPKISPNKTIMGAISGLIASVATSLLLFVLFNSIAAYRDMMTAQNMTIVAFVIYGLLASVFSQFGDIFASLVKRQNNVKDYGWIFPGHGGFMDRVDGVSFNAVFSLIFFAILLSI